MSEKLANETMEAYVIRLIREEERQQCIAALEGYQTTLRVARYDDLFGSGYNQAIRDAIDILRRGELA